MLDRLPRPAAMATYKVTLVNANEGLNRTITAPMTSRSSMRRRIRTSICPSKVAYEHN